MLKLTPILLAVAYGLIFYRFSAWRTAKELDAKSTELADPRLKALTDKMATALDLPRRLRRGKYQALTPAQARILYRVAGMSVPDEAGAVTRKKHIRRKKNRR